MKTWIIMQIRTAMGDTISCLNITWSTQVRELITNNLESWRIFGHITLERLLRFANDFSEQITVGGIAAFNAVLRKSVFITSVAVEMSGLAFRQLADCSKHVLEAIADQAMKLSFQLRNQLFIQLENIVTALCKNAKSFTIAETYHNILNEAVKSSNKSKGVQVAQSISGAAAVAEEVVKNTTKYSKAAQCAKASLKVGVVVDGVCLAFCIYKSYKKYTNEQISWEEHRETVMKRIGGAAGSVGMEALGTFVGTLVFPGVGSFVGGVIGGMAGDYLGSWAGNKADRALFYRRVQ